MSTPKQTINRRQFIGTLGAAAAVTGLAACTHKAEQQTLLHPSKPLFTSLNFPPLWAVVY